MDFFDKIKVLEVSPHVTIMVVTEGSIVLEPKMIDATAVQPSNGKKLKINLCFLDEGEKGLMIPQARVDWILILVDLEDRTGRDLTLSIAKKLNYVESLCSLVYHAGKVSIVGVYGEEGSELRSPAIDNMLLSANFCLEQGFDYKYSPIFKLSNVMREIIKAIMISRKDSALSRLSELLKSGTS